MSLNEEEEPSATNWWELGMRFAMVFGVGFLFGWFFNLWFAKIPNPNCLFSQTQAYAELVKIPVEITTVTWQMHFFRVNGKWTLQP